VFMTVAVEVHVGHYPVPERPCPGPTASVTVRTSRPPLLEFVPLANVVRERRVPSVRLRRGRPSRTHEEAAGDGDA
jgi:hypothetical protein